MYEQGESFTDHTEGAATRTPPARRLASAILARYVRDVIGNEEYDRKTGFYVRYYHDEGEAWRDYHGSQEILERVSYQADYDPEYVRGAIRRLLEQGVSDRDVSKAASH